MLPIDLMKLLATLLPILLLLTACSSTPSAGRNDPTTNEGEIFRSAPPELIAALPQRIYNAKLQPNTNPYEFINQLGLGQWADNLSHQQKFESYFLPLSSRHVLQIRCDPDSLVITEADAQAIQAGQVLSSSPDWLKDPIVIGATLRQDWDTALVNRTY